MDATFVLVVARAGRSIPGHVRAMLAASAPPELPFATGERLEWRSADGGVALSAWTRPTVPSGNGGWVAAPGRVLCTVGRARWSGDPYLGSDRWPAVLDARWPRTGVDPMPGALDALRGTATVVAAEAGGTATVHGDPMGWAFTYLAESDDVVAVSSSAVLAAAAVAPAGARPERDPLTPAALLATPYVIGDRSGYRGVRVLAAGAWVRVDAGGTTEVVEPRAPWLDVADLAGLGPAELVDGIVAEIADELRAALGTGPVVVDLTGGKDSRLVAAVAVLEGLAGDLRFRTVGPPDLVDVQVAASLADALGLRHESSFDLVPHATSYRDRSLTFLAATGGAASIWDTKVLRAPTGEVRVSGTSGECLRAHDLQRDLDQPHADALAAIRASARARALDLLRPEAAAAVEDDRARAFFDPALHDAATGDVVSTYNMRHRERRHRGPFDGMEADLRLFPLSGLHAVRRAFALGVATRQLAFVHWEVCRRASPVLLHHPFAGPGWADGLPEGPPPPEVPPSAASEPAPAARGDQPASTTAKAEPLMARLQRSPDTERDELFADLLADAANPAWQVIDRDATAEAWGRFDTLIAKQRRQVFGAMTTALWLGR